MPSMSSINRRRDICTPVLETYFTAFLSTLPTIEVNDGSPLAPGGGCVIAAPGGPIMGEHDCVLWDGPYP